MTPVMKNYPCPVNMKKYFLEGMLEGLTVDESMGFVSWDDACDWAGKVTMSGKVPYVILEMTNVKTGEKENF
jgi:hypothetical protein